VIPLLDVEAVPTFMASRNAQQLNWQTSIVDLMTPSSAWKAA
jgi:hypothetical protein